MPLILQIWQYVFSYEMGKSIPISYASRQWMGTILVWRIYWEYVNLKRFKAFSKVEEERISPMHEYLSIFTCTQIIEMQQINFMLEYVRNFNEYIPTAHHSNVTDYVTIMTYRQLRFGWIGHLKYEYKLSIDWMMTNLCTYIVKYTRNNHILNHTKGK